MLEVSFENSDGLLLGKQVLQSNGFKCDSGSTYRDLRVDCDDKKSVIKLLKREKIKCSTAVVKN